MDQRAQALELLALLLQLCSDGRGSLCDCLRGVGGHVALRCHQGAPEALLRLGEFSDERLVQFGGDVCLRGGHCCCNLQAQVLQLGGPALRYLVVCNCRRVAHLLLHVRNSGPHLLLHLSNDMCLGFSNCVTDQARGLCLRRRWVHINARLCKPDHSLKFLLLIDKARQTVLNHGFQFFGGDDGLFRAMKVLFLFGQLCLNTDELLIHLIKLHIHRIKLRGQMVKLLQAVMRALTLQVELAFQCSNSIRVVFRVWGRARINRRNRLRLARRSNSGRALKGYGIRR